jgi:pSer/pThr/pTyr-binding forkhead associated (FHA) protein
LAEPQDPHRRHGATPAEMQALNAMTRIGWAFLAWRDDAGVLQLHPLERPRITIGRSPQSTIALPWDRTVSSLHAEVESVDDEWLVVDDGLSRNGTHVAGERVTGRARLRDQDRIRVGGTILVFHRPTGSGERTELGGAQVVRSDLIDTEWLVLLALCRPMVRGNASAPAPNKVIAGETHLTVEGVKRCLTRLYEEFGLKDSDAKRLDLVHAATSSGLVGPRVYE